LVLVTMKNAARCETWRDTQNLRDVEFLNAACARGAICRHVCLGVLITLPGNWPCWRAFRASEGPRGAPCPDVSCLLAGVCALPDRSVNL
jgi:hypothetical protein